MHSVTAGPIRTRPGAGPPHVPGRVLGYPDPGNSGPPGYPLYCGGEGILVGRGPLASRWGEGGEGDGSLPTHSTTKPLEGGGRKHEVPFPPPPPSRMFSLKVHQNLLQKGATSQDQSCPCRYFRGATSEDQSCPCRFFRGTTSEEQSCPCRLYKGTIQGQWRAAIVRTPHPT